MKSWNIVSEKGKDILLRMICSPKKILKPVLQFVESYNAYNYTSLEDLTATVLDEQELDPEDEDLVIRMFLGCVKFDAALEAVLSLFDPLLSQKNEYDIIACKVLVYLILFELKNIGLDQFIDIVAVYFPPKIYKFLKSFLSSDRLENDLKNKWLEFYEEDFVTTTLLDPLLSYCDAVLCQLDQLHQQLHESKTKPQVRAVTEVKPFNLSESKPRPIPEPMPKLLKEFKSRPLPKSIHSKAKVDEIIQLEKKKNKDRAQILLDKVKSFEPNYARTIKTDKGLQKMAQLQEDNERQLRFDRRKANEVPQTDPVNLSKNTTVILRENAVIKKKLLSELQKLKDLEAGNFDDDQFQQWRENLEKEERQQEQIRLQKRYLEGRLAKEQAALAKQEVLQKTQKEVQQMKEEWKQMKMEQQQRKQQRLQQIREASTDLIPKIKEAKEKAVQEKRKLAKEVHEENILLHKRYLEESEKDMKRKAALIQEIRALESFSLPKMKNLEESNTSEMSIMELRERLALLKEHRREDEEEKRKEIKKEKQLKEQQLALLEEGINNWRKAQALVRQEKMAQIKTEDEVSASIQEELVELKRRLDEKRATRLTPFKTKHGGKGNKMVSKLQQLDDARQRFGNLAFADNVY